MKRFGDFLFISEGELKKKEEQKKDSGKEDRIAKAKEILEKAKVKKEKLAGPNEFMGDPKNEAPGVKKYDEMVAASTSPGGGGATGKSMDQSQKRMGKDDKPHKEGSPEDKAHDVVEEGQKVGQAAEQVKGDPKKMFEHLRSYREMQAEGKGDEWKRSPKNAEMGKSGVSDPMLMSLKDMKKEAKPESAPSAKPPKEWWDKKTAEVKAGNPSYSEEQVAATVGKIWSDMSHGQKKGRREAEGKTYHMPKSLNEMKKEATKKNDPAVSGTKVESQASGEMGNRAKAKDDSISPLKSEPKQMIAEPVGDKYAKASMQKSMKEGGGVQWTDADVRLGLAFSAGGKVGATEGPNLAAQPLVKKEVRSQEKGREVPLHRVLEDMDDSKVKT